MSTQQKNTCASTLRMSVDFNTPIYTVSEPYLSFNIDSASLFQDAEGGKLNFSDPNLQNLGRDFCSSSPGGAIVRIGGSSADDLVFVVVKIYSHHKWMLSEL